MPCEERKRLEKIYLDAVRKNAIAGTPIPNTKTKAWREATKETRVAALGKDNFVKLLGVLPQTKESILHTVQARAKQVTANQ